jgi:hypothetical protein
MKTQVHLLFLAKLNRYKTFFWTKCCLPVRASLRLPACISAADTWNKFTYSMMLGTFLKIFREIANRVLGEKMSATLHEELGTFYYSW